MVQAVYAPDCWPQPAVHWEFSYSRSPSDGGSSVDIDSEHLLRTHGTLRQMLGVPLYTRGTSDAAADGISRLARNRLLLKGLMLNVIAGCTATGTRTTRTGTDRHRAATAECLAKPSSSFTVWLICSATVSTVSSAPVGFQKSRYQTAQKHPPPTLNSLQLHGSIPPMPADGDPYSACSD